MEFRQPINALWKGAPEKPSAAVYCRMTKSLYLFEGEVILINFALNRDKIFT